METLAMRELRRTAMVNQPPAVVFALVSDVASYPQFVPGCAAAEILERTDDEVVARLTVRRGALRTHFTTRNRHSPPGQVHMQLVDGPLRSLDGDWRFTAVGEHGCQIELQLNYQFSNPLKAALLEPLFVELADQMVRAFVKRAQQLDEQR
jgi:ribosome-associated toxin RatA of RatAB toxin-antitoxin module